MQGSKKKRPATLTEIKSQIAKKDFWEFRKKINKKLKVGWWQIEVAQELQQFIEDLIAGRKPILIIQAPPQHGKLIADKVPVLTTKGWKAHGDLTAGDKVFHPSGAAIKVLAVSRKDTANMRVELSNGEIIHCHERHEWTVFNRDKKRYETIETSEFLKHGNRSKRPNPLYTGALGERGSHYVYKLPPTNHIIGSEKKLPVNPYTLGAWLGDGSQTKPLITYDKNDYDVIQGIIDDGYKIGSTHAHKDTGVFSTSFPSLVGGLRKAGVYAEKYRVRNKHIPDIYLTASINHRLELLAGLIDTDGYTYQKNGRMVFTTSDIKLADSFCNLLSTFGWNFSKVTEQPKISSSGIVGKKEYYVIGFNPDLEIPCRLKRKKNIPKKKAYRVAIKSVSYEDLGLQGNCIQVDSQDGLYLVGKTMQPTHNSVQVIDLLAWVSGRYPHLRQIFSSFSKRLGIRANLRLQRICASEEFKEIFPDLRLPTSKDKGYSKTMELIEFVGEEGSFRNTTALGSITGESLDLGIIDDPIKGREAANSDTIRDKTWEWFADDFFTRFSEDAGLLIIGTRWHVDDPIGRLIESNPENLKILKYEAIATKDEKHRIEGEPLFPELKSLSFILARKKLQGRANFEALYQQSPVDEDGSIFREEDFGWYHANRKYKRVVISWDTANKAGELNDPSVATVWGEHSLGYDLLEVVKDKMKYPRLKRDAIALAHKWKAMDVFSGHKLLTVLIEDKSSGQSLIQDLKEETTFNIVAINPESDKVTRASTCSPQVEDGKVFLKIGASWLDDYLYELTKFPNAPTDDQVDSTSQFLNWIAGGVIKMTDDYF